MRSAQLSESFHEETKPYRELCPPLTIYFIYRDIYAKLNNLLHKYRTYKAKGFVYPPKYADLMKKNTPQDRNQVTITNLGGYHHKVSVRGYGDTMEHEIKIDVHNKVVHCSFR